MLRNNVQDNDKKAIYCLSTKIVDKSVHGSGDSGVPTASLRARERLGEILTILK
jgi:hypothetical protein